MWAYYLAIKDAFIVATKILTIVLIWYYGHKIATELHTIRMRSTKTMYSVKRNTSNDMKGPYMYEIKETKTTTARKPKNTSVKANK